MPGANVNNYHKQTIATDIDMSDVVFALVVNDEDLEGVQTGTVLLIDPIIPPEHRDFVIAHRAGQKTPNLKKLLVHEGERYLKPLNDEFKTVQLDNQYRIIGVVVQMRMDRNK